MLEDFFLYFINFFLFFLVVAKIGSFLDILLLFLLFIYPKQVNQKSKLIKLNRREVSSFQLPRGKAQKFFLKVFLSFIYLLLLSKEREGDRERWRVCLCIFFFKVCVFNFFHLISFFPFFH